MDVDVCKIILVTLKGRNWAVKSNHVEYVASCIKVAHGNTQIASSQEIESLLGELFGVCWLKRILVFSPDTDTIHIGLTQLQFMPKRKCLFKQAKAWKCRLRSLTLMHWLRPWGETQIFTKFRTANGHKCYKVYTCAQVVITCPSSEASESALSCLLSINTQPLLQLEQSHQGPLEMFPWILGVFLLEVGGMCLLPTTRLSLWAFITYLTLPFPRW